MSTLDHDKDGRISYDEFREGFEVHACTYICKPSTEHEPL